MLKALVKSSSIDRKIYCVRGQIAISESSFLIPKARLVFT